MEDAFQQKLSGAAPHGERHTHCPRANHVVVDPDLMADALRAIDAILEEEDVAISRVLLPTSPTSANDDDDRSFHQTRREAAGVHYLRSWFLSNLAHPFPSRAERQKMASIASTTPRNVESSFTNWRRRSGWSAVRRKWGGQSRTGMRLLIQRYEARSLEPEASDAISKMRSYFANDKARSCIEEVSSP
ncbi:sexual development regulator [Trichosporon asahii var. asahii CBS 8904]|uniref:Sexual development regulator n=1 Tax=Trichosporon asahii var. asahii (strain CBS 8904) TaxID=1220162 RepID=K1W9J4_TRIAC|nr:sexual development regulator [Trichosporon asahii var. asahii CBS 8904]